MNSYGKLGTFEIRDKQFIDRDEDSMKTGKFDLVEWKEDNFDSKYCYSIATLTFRPDEGDFKLESVGMRFVKETTEELNEWLLKWCELKSFELNKLEESE